ncbi:MAG TPA: hypothetical protein VGA18_08550, partial [Rhodothermales bacterium]
MIVALLFGDVEAVLTDQEYLEMNQTARIATYRLQFLALVTTLIAVIGAGTVAAQAPGTISFQGKLTDTGGAPTNATVPMTFTLYKGSTDVWSETQPSVQVTDGVFNVLLGSVTPLDTVAFSQPIDLGITVGGDSEITPRTPLVASAFSLGMRGLYATQVESGAIEAVNVIGGSEYNSVAPDVVGATIAGGGGRNTVAVVIFPNNVTGDFGTIGGGGDNTAGLYATVGGGVQNSAIGERSFVGGGQDNLAGDDYATVAGGVLNQALGVFSTVA